jgi:hypothetical protein
MLPTPTTRGPLARPHGDVEHTRLRLRMLDGHAQEDVKRYILRRVGEVRARAWGQPLCSTSPISDLSAAVAVLYTLDPTLGHPTATPEAAEAERATVADVAERLRISGLWQVAAEAQRLAEALNECAIHFELSDGALLWRVVTPDLLEGDPAPGRPGEPALLREWRPRRLGADVVWCADEYDVRDPSAPVFRVLDEDDNDVTAQAVGAAPGGGAWAGPAYPWRYSPTPAHPEGRPFLPYSLRHASPSPRALFSAWGRRETVDATLEACLIDTETSHVCTQAAFPFTYSIGCRIAGEQITLPDGRVIARAPVLDPAAIHELEVTAEPGVQPAVQAVRNETDPLMLMDVSERIVARCASAWGLGPSDIQRTAADSRSGVALAISSEGRRRMQASRAPIYQPHDERLVGRVCALLNRAAVGGITDRPESGWQVAYTLSPLSPQERSQRQAEGLTLYTAGLITGAELRAMVLGETPAQAQAAVAAIGRAAVPPSTP